MPAATHKPDAWQDAAERSRYVYVVRARCPVCQSSELQTIRSTDQGDGTTKRHVRCRAEHCGHKFFVILE